MKKALLYLANLGNRIASTQNETETRHSFNARNQLIRTIDRAVDDGEYNNQKTGTTNGIISDYIYDQRGNLTQITENGQVESTYTFDATNMMTAAFTANKGNAKYSYDGFRNRVKKLENLQDTHLNVLDPCNELCYVLDITRPYNNLITLKNEGANDKAQNFIWGNSLLSAHENNSDAQVINHHSAFNYLHDHLGTPIRLFGDDNNNEAIAHDEFGVPQVSQSKGIYRNNNPFGFTGYQTDNISNMHYAQARYYSPKVGRFTAEDPIKDKLNWYSYCGGNPVVFVDPTGLSEDDIVSPFSPFPNISFARPSSEIVANIILSEFVQFGISSFGTSAVEELTQHIASYIFHSRLAHNVRGVSSTSRRAINNQLTQIGHGVRRYGAVVSRGIPLTVPLVFDAFDVRWRFRDDRNNEDISTVRAGTNIFANVSLNTGITLLSLWAAAAAGGTAGGKAGAAAGTAVAPGPGSAVGAAVGTIAGFSLFAITEFFVFGDKTVREHIQYGVYENRDDIMQGAIYSLPPSLIPIGIGLRAYMNLLDYIDSQGD